VAFGRWLSAKAAELRAGLQFDLGDFGTVVLPHHDQQASDDQNPTEHGQMFSSTMLLPNLIPLIDVTFSTPTGHYTY
jgi:hypothetical protein